MLLRVETDNEGGDVDNLLADTVDAEPLALVTRPVDPNHERTGYASA